MVKGDCQKESQVNHNKKILALVEGSRQMGFQVDLATYMILVLVKGDRQMGLSLV